MELRTSLSLSSNAFISAGTARESPISPKALAVELRTSLSLSSNAFIRAGTARESPIFTKASAADQRTHPSSSPNAFISAGTPWGSPISPKTSAMASRTSEYSSFFKASAKPGTARLSSIWTKAWAADLRTHQSSNAFISAGTAGLPISTNPDQFCLATR
ncbi:hypothetical protein ES707_16407 [subsurface metagenome]